MNSAPRFALLRASAVGALALALGGCSDVDEALFGPYPVTQTAPATAANSDSDQSAPAAADSTAGSDKPAANESTPAPAAEQEASAEPSPKSPPPSEAPPSEAPPPEAPALQAEAETSPSSDEGSAALPGTLPASAGLATAEIPGSDVTPVRIEAGSDTGTAMGKTVAGLRGEVSALGTRLMENARQLQSLRESGARETARYQEARAQILTRLQVGTTRGNPELVNRWNVAQGALDHISANVNALAQLGSGVTADSHALQQALQQIAASESAAGGNDEDHRQLTVLEDETRQMVVSYDRLRSDVSVDIPRQTAFVANERASLAQLAAAIKRGELYS